MGCRSTCRPGIPTICFVRCTGNCERPSSMADCSRACDCRRRARSQALWRVAEYRGGELRSAAERGLSGRASRRRDLCGEASRDRSVPKRPQTMRRRPPLDVFRRKAETAPRTTLGVPYRFDFRMAPDKALFPFQVWRRLSARALRALSKAPRPMRRPKADRNCAMRRQTHLVRPGRCLSAEDVVVTAGAQQALDLLARVLVTPGRTAVAIEDPSYPPLRAVFAAAGANITAVRSTAKGWSSNGCRPAHG